MKLTIQDLLEKSEKRTIVQYNGKAQSFKFDENFGKEKLDLIDSALGMDKNKQLIIKKLSK